MLYGATMYLVTLRMFSLVSMTEYVGWPMIELPKYSLGGKA